MLRLIPLTLIAACLPAAAAEPPARLLSYANSVLYRRAGSADWGKVSEGLPLFRQDTVYTMAGSSAEVRFLTGETLSLTANTLVVLRPPGARGADAAMLSGELRGARSRVVTRGASIRPKSPDAEFSAKVKADFTTVVSVTRGVAEVEAQGKKVDVARGYLTEVKLNEPPSVPVLAPKVPGQAPPAPAAGPPPPAAAPAVPGPAPRAGAAVVEAPRAELPPNALEAVQAVRGYHVQVSKSLDFREPVLDKVFDELDSGRLAELLPPGDYFIRAAKIDLLGYEGAFSRPRPLRLGLKKEAATF